MMQWVYLGLGSLCTVYYFAVQRHAQSWIWLAVGLALLAVWRLSPREIPTVLRVLWRGLFCVGIALVIAMECLVMSEMNIAPPKDLDVLLVLGARVREDGPSRALRYRIDSAVDYMKENPNTVAVASGGKGGDEHISEAQCIFDEMVVAGIDPSRILMEDQSTTTAENMSFSKALLPSGDVRVGVVTNNYHVFRSVRLARRAGIEGATGVPAPFTGISLPHYMIREGAGLLAEKLRGTI